MDTAAFRSDLELIPASLRALADVLDDASPTLDARPRTMLLGMGSSAFAAAAPARTARSRGRTVVSERASATPLPEPADDLLVVAVSATGGSAEVLAAAEPYAGRGLVALTNRPDSPLAELAGTVVEMHAGVEASGVACRTYRHTLAVLTALLVPGARVADACRRAADASEDLLTGAPGWVPGLADLLAGPAGTHVLAPEERLGSAQQAALMMREVPRRAAYACETGDWSHVDVYLTTTYDYRALVLAGSRWDAPALAWLTERGSRFAAVGADLPGAAVTVRHRGEDDPLVAALTEVLVGELVADTWRAQRA